MVTWTVKGMYHLGKAEESERGGLVLYIKYVIDYKEIKRIK